MATNILETPLQHDKPVDQADLGKVPTEDPNGGDQWHDRCDAVVTQFVDAFVELISDFGAPEQVQRGCANSLRDFVTTPDELTYWARAKNIVCFFKARFLRNPEPDVKGYVFGGAWKRWATSRFVMNRRNVSLWASTFKVKNAAARLSERAAVATMHKHSKSVSRTFQSDPRVVEDAVRTIQPLLEEAAVKIADDFYSGRWEDPVAASNSACYESSRRTFGQIGHFMERVFGSGVVVCPGLDFCGFGPQIRAGSTPCSLPKDILRQKENNRRWIEEARGSEDVERLFLLELNQLKLEMDFPEGDAYDYDLYLRRLDYVMREEEPAIKRVTFYEEVTVDGVRYNNSWFETYYFPNTELVWNNEILIDALKACSRDLALAKVACVLEPFKIRIITKGEAALQYVSTHFQKSAFEFNKTVSCFRLVGKAPSVLDLIDLRKGAKGFVNPQWASSDFSGASDGTSGHLRDCIFDCLVQHLPLHIQSILRSCNGDHRVSYPGPTMYPSMHDLGKVDPVVQTLGTLMGEKTSFIVLCYEVLVAHVSSRRRLGDRRDLKHLLDEVLINGDDRLTISNSFAEAEFWSFCERNLGFSESKGKSYLHPSYANINSQSYIYDLRRPDSTPYKVPVRCSGLEHGQKKLDEPFDPTAVITQILDGCFDSKMEWVVLQRYFKRFGSRLVELAAGRNLFVHPSLGGIGNRLPLVHPNRRCKDSCHHRFGQSWKVEVTPDQLEVAAALVEAANGVVLPCGPSPMLEDDLPQLFETPWDVYGKPTYWNQEESLHKSMADYFRGQISQYNGNWVRVGGRMEVRDGSQSRIRLTRSDLLEGRLRTLKSVSQSFMATRRVTEKVWRCNVCNEWNPVYERQCHLCLVAYEKISILAFGNRVVTQVATRSTDVEESGVRMRRNVSLGSERLERKGYSPGILDEFDISLYDHAIESARFELEGNPVVRFNGRAVDLFGDNPSWAPLRPATLVW